MSGATQAGDLRSQQRTVGKGVAVAIACMSTIIGGIYAALNPLPGMEQLPNRLAYAVGCNAVAVFTLLLGIMLVGNARALSGAINPLAGLESERTKIYGRYLSNTLEQFVLFAAVILALSLYLTNESMRLLPALTANFVVGRAIFLVGYLRNPLHRATGFAMTMYPTVACLGYVLWQIVTNGTFRS